jgi:enamine deaminase RidA (YjgF/YER057c/UK114 family)
MNETALFASENPGDLIFLSVAPPSGVALDAESFVRQAYVPIGRVLDERQAVILSERIYGSLTEAQRVIQARRAAVARAETSTAVTPTYVEGAPCQGKGVAGLHVIAVRKQGDDDRLITHGETTCGRVIRGQDAWFLGISDAGCLVREGTVLAAREETRRTLTAVEHLLARLGWSFTQIQRTWFYLDRILDWYGDFNDVRNETFRRLGMLERCSPTSLPASTGIRGRNFLGGLCTLDFIATAPVDGRRHFARRLTHRGQNEATDYGSAFARGLELDLESCRYVFVSGTASIDENGKTVHAGDFGAQMRRTLAAVKSLLAAADAEMCDICQATAFLKRAGDIDAYRSILGDEGLLSLPIVCVLADVCRDDLLFELDATAVLPRRKR